MSEMEKNLNLTVIRKQIGAVTEVLAQNDLLYPNGKNHEVEKELIERELVQHLLSFEGVWFIRYLHYKDTQIHIHIQMTDVTTDGKKTEMTPVIGFIQLVNSPLRNKNSDFSSIQKLCNEAIEDALAVTNV